MIDIGGSGLKATVLDAQGEPVHERVRVDTTYPCPPEKLVADLVRLVDALPPYQRVSAGFPGVVREGLVLTAPHFVTLHGPGSTVDDSLVKSWERFDLRGALSAALGVPARVANDADVQGAGVVTGRGLELVLTLGTGLGSCVFRDGALALHLELAHHPAIKRGTYNDYVGDRARKKLGVKHWNRRVVKTLIAVDALIFPDAILVGGGNARRVDVAKLQKRRPDLAGKVTLVGNAGGLLGGIRLWELQGLD
ncbi:MAG: ROK family protein [Actinobacteria bacterium]|nr:ROK family protein [Actinomycetota bacterium]